MNDAQAASASSMSDTPNVRATPHEGWTRREMLQVGAAAAAMAPMSILSKEPDASVEPQQASASASRKVELTINGKLHAIDVDVRTSLLDLLREHLGLTGTKKGCNQGACGACTVLLDGKRINACLTLAVMHQGAHVTTIEGLADGTQLQRLQAAFIEHDAFQCGYCTAGQIMSGVGCIAEGHTGSVQEIRAWMSGNICRCGAYPGICAAVAQAAAGSMSRTED